MLEDRRRGEGLCCERFPSVSSFLPQVPNYLRRCRAKCIESVMGPGSASFALCTTAMLEHPFCV